MQIRERNEENGRETARSLLTSDMNNKNGLFVIGNRYIYTLGLKLVLIFINIKTIHNLKTIQLTGMHQNRQ